LSNRSGWVNVIMPRVHAENGFTILMYPPPREHGPPHVHVRYAGTEVVVTLSLGGEALTIGRIEGMHNKDVVQAVNIVASLNDMLLIRWREFHDA
jgi:hypothetical protein